MTKNQVLIQILGDKALAAEFVTKILNNIGDNYGQKFNTSPELYLNVLTCIYTDWQPPKQGCDLEVFVNLVESAFRTHIPPKPNMNMRVRSNIPPKPSKNGGEGVVHKNIQHDKGY